MNETYRSYHFSWATLYICVITIILESNEKTVQSIVIRHTIIEGLSEVFG